MTEKRLTLKEYYDLSAMDIIEIVNEQHETIQALEFLADEHKRQKNEIVQKVKDTLQWIYNDSKVISSKERQKAVELIAKELEIELQ